MHTVIALVLVFALAASAATITWSGYTWTKRDTGSSTEGPGPNYWSASNVAVSGTKLVLTIGSVGGRMSSSEIYMDQTLGYGLYSWDVEGKAETICSDPNVVLGFFLYRNDTSEVDIEYSRWGQTDANADNMDYVNQPSSGVGARETAFKIKTGITVARHSFLWAPKYIAWEARDISSGAPGTVVKRWNTTNAPIPSPTDPGAIPIHINFWMFDGNTPATSPVSVTVDSFTFTKLEDLTSSATISSTPVVVSSSTPTPASSSVAVSSTSPASSAADYSQTGKTSVTWSGYTWTVRDQGDSASGPGPNRWSMDNVAVGNGKLTMKITGDTTPPSCSEIYLSTGLGYGLYSWVVEGKAEDITSDSNIVLGLFLYRNDTSEIDIEYARWGETAASAKNMDYVNQPTGDSTRASYWSMPKGVSLSRQQFLWTPTEISWQAYSLASATDSGTLVNSWSTTTAPIPTPEGVDPIVVHINFWMFRAKQPTQSTNTVVLDSFKFTKLSDISSATAPTSSVPPASSSSPAPHSSVAPSSAPQSSTQPKSSSATKQSSSPLVSSAKSETHSSHKSQHTSASGSSLLFPTVAAVVLTMALLL